MDPGVGPERGHELTVPDVDSGHLPGTGPEQHVGEASRGGSGVEAPPPGDDDAGKGRERTVELVTRPADILRPGGLHEELLALVDGGGGLEGHLAVTQDAACGDELGGVGA